MICVILLTGLTATARAGEDATAELHKPGKPLALPESAQQELCQQAVQLVETSNFHSGPGDQYHVFKSPEVQSSYREEVAGKFLLILFSTPRLIKTTGGEITVSEIVVGLNRDDYASSLFTIDDSGRIVGHGKYAGERCILLLDAVKRLAPAP